MPKGEDMSVTGTGELMDINTEEIDREGIGHYQELQRQAARLALLVSRLTPHPLETEPYADGTN
ncbi:MAG TPA: hypothetical protein VH234_05325 [Candidatus Saccharimonadales bacterium]|jgi:hypothetical protein|nr:hypothetical protein [Candidatus Saccharimonadales bacterium]